MQTASCPSNKLGHTVTESANYDFEAAYLKLEVDVLADQVHRHLLYI